MAALWSSIWQPVWCSVWDDPWGKLSEVDRIFRSAALDLNFAKTKTLDSRVTFTRASGGTYFDENGVMQTAADNVARFDHDPATGESLGLLVEESRTNLFERSQGFPTSYWTYQNTLSDGEQTSPTGQQNANRVITSSSTGATLRRVQVNIALSAGTYTFSMFVKADGRSVGELRAFVSSLINARVEFDLSNRAITTGGAGFESASLSEVGNGWFRARLTFTIATAQTVLCIFGMLPVGVDQTNGIVIFGAQLEVGA